MDSQKLIIINRSLGEVRAAVIENEAVTDIRLYRDDVPSYVGTVFLGRVTKLSKELQAAYINLGKNLSGFLPLKNLPKTTGRKPKDLTTLLHEGQRLIVQVTGDARSEKQLKLTGRIELVAPSLVFYPHRTGAYVSSRINIPDRREELKAFGRSLDLKEYGLTFRTDAGNVENSQLSKLAGHLITHWQSATRNLKSCKCPCILSQAPEATHQILREFCSSNIDQILVDDAATLKKAKEWLGEHSPEHTLKLSHYRAKEPIFEHYGVEDKIENIYSTGINLKSGGWITIEKTEALTAIDVNMGGATFSSDKNRQVFSLNREAAREIFRQLRMRSIGGIIVIDFIDMTDRGDVKSLQNYIDELIANDPAPLQRGNISSFGLMELTRRSKEISLDELLLEKAHNKKTLTSACLDTLRHASANAASKPGRPQTITVNNEMKEWFKRRPELIDEFTRKTGSALILEEE